MALFQNVLLIGAGGNLGTVVLQTFIHSRYKVTVLSRKESTSKFPESVHVIKADYDDPLSLKYAMDGQDVVISMVGGAVTGDQDRFIDAAVAAGVKRFLPSEFGPNTQDPRVHEIIPVLPAKLNAVNYLKTKESQMEWTSLITSLWVDWIMKTGLGGFDATTRTAALIDDGTTSFTATTLPQVGRAILAILEHADLTKNKYVYSSSFHTTQKEVVGVLEKLDGQKWTVTHEKSNEVIDMGKKMFQQGDYNGVGHLVRAMAFGSSGLGDSRPAGLWDEKLGLEPEDMEQTIRDVLRDMRAG